MDYEKEQDEAKLIEYFVKVLDGTATQADYLEILIHKIIDITVKDSTERQIAKMKVSKAKEIAEKMNK